MRPDETLKPPAVRPGALQRMIDAHRPAPVPPPDFSAPLSAAWSRALRHAGVPMPALHLSVTQVAAVQDPDLARGIAGLPAEGLVILIEDDAGARGVLALSHPLLDALIEVQTTGAVERQVNPPRKVTQIDLALSRDFIDLTLAHFAQLADQEPVAWPRRMQFGTAIPDRTQLTLLLRDGAYHRLSAEVTLGAGGADGGPPRAAMAVMLLPVTDRSPVRAKGAASEETDAPPLGPALRARLDQTQTRLDAILLRQTRPLDAVRGLAVGDLVFFDAADLNAVQLELAPGHVIAHGKLGRQRGRRAVRVNPSGTRSGQAEDASAAPQDASEDPTARAGEATDVPATEPAPAAGPGPPPPNLPSVS